MALLTIKLDGNEYKLDLDEIDNTEARYIKRHTGLSLLKLQDGLAEADVDALDALYWLMMKQNGQTTDIARLSYKAAQFSAAVFEASIAEQKRQEEAGEDPKEPKS